MGRTYYRTRDNRANFLFSFERQPDGCYRAYILRQPGYGRLPADLHTTHRLRDGRGRLYVCWTSPLRSEQEARTVAALWADLTQVYLRTGKSIDRQTAEPRQRRRP